MAGRIFINYRRGDDPGYTQALFQRLEGEFGRDALFMDVEGYIKAGDDFVHVLDAQVAQSDVLLAVIGPRWVAAQDETGRRRLDNPDDFVRIEIASALEQGKRLIPVLVGGAPVPRVEDLPEPLKLLARRNAVRLTHERFPSDCAGLVKDLRGLLEELEAARAGKSETERRAAEEAARRKQEEEAARAAEAQRQAEARAREQAAAGLSVEEIRKAEELANWDFIKGAANVAELRNHLARFPGGVTERYAQAALEELVWAGLGASPALDALETFLAEFPSGKHVVEASARRERFQRQADAARAAGERRRQETEAWAAASTGNRAAVEAFLRDWPSGEHAGAAEARIKELRQGPFRRRLVFGIGVAGALMGVAGFFALVSVADIIDSVRPLPAFAEPEMVTVPAGSFMMGSPNGEGADDEHPSHKVTIAKPFAVGKYEVTFDEWDNCVKEGGCKHTPSSEGWGRGRRPVIHVSWDDAKKFAAWLSKKTGKPYRLPTEAEWEYAARAGTKTKYAFGDTITVSQAQFGASKTAEVGSFKPNAFGLHDMHGNVWEWVEDTRHDTYEGAPSDGTAWIEGDDASRRVLRGGSWLNDPDFLRSTNRNRVTTDNRINNYGFRVGRTLTP